MSEKNRDLLLKELKRCSGQSSVKLTKSIQFDWTPDSHTVVMKLDSQSTGAGEQKKSKNMQDSSAAFEAWAIILHTCLDTHPTIRLERQEKGKLHDIGPGLGHYNRFLYRLIKFNEAYSSWFTIDPDDVELSARVKEFGEYLQAHPFCNNIPDGEAGEGTRPEGRAETAFERNQSLLGRFAEEGTIHRQLPVGLFEGSRRKDCKDDNLVFTGDKSAIDLWGLQGDVLAIFELKTSSTDANDEVGIITELMFYCNLMRDMYINRENRFRPRNPHLNRRENLKKLRGYDKLWERKETLTEVRGYLLVDVLHPLITEEVLGEMSASGIPYDALRYDWDPAAQVPVSNVRKWF